MKEKTLMHSNYGEALEFVKNLSTTGVIYKWHGKKLETTLLHRLDEHLVFRRSVEKIVTF